MYEFILKHVNPGVIEPTFYSDHLLFGSLDEDDKPSIYTFTSYHLNSFKSPDEIWSKGLFLLKLFKGAYTVVNDPRCGEYPAIPLAFDRLYNDDQNITPSEMDEIVPRVAFSNYTRQRDSYLAAASNSSPVSRLIECSEKKVDIRNILLQVGHGIGWINLYSILDSIVHYSKKKIDEIKILAGYSTSDLKDFGHTVNNFGVLSHNARHGELGWTPPSDPMSLSDAQVMILKLARSYFNIVYNINP